MPLRVLVVDGYPDAAEMIGMLVRLAGHHVEIATDGRGGLAIARRWKPDLMVMSTLIPGMSGLELAKAIRTDNRLAETHLVCITRFSSDEALCRTKEAGFDEVYTKPIDPEALLRIVASLEPKSDGFCLR